MTSGEAFAKYHAEHVKHGGASWEFHARAQTFCATAASRIATLEQHVSDLEKSLENARKERDEAMRETHAADVARATEQETSARLRRELDEAVADNAVLVKAATMAAAELRHTYGNNAGGGGPIDPNLVARAIRLLEVATAQPHPGVALLEEHRKALVRARNEGRRQSEQRIRACVEGGAGCAMVLHGVANAILDGLEPEPT